MSANPHFQGVSSWGEARPLITFDPVQPNDTAGATLQSLAVFVRDHKMRDVPVSDRTLEAYYGEFSFTQSRKAGGEARRMAIEVPYGRWPCEARIGVHEARTYDLGPEPDPGDIDPRSPAVVTWHDGEMFYLVASDTLDVDVLLRIARSIYAHPPRTRADTQGG